MPAMAVAPGRKLLATWLAFLIVVPLLPALARADDRTIVLLEVEGEEKPRVTKALERMVKNGNEILRGSTYRDAARRLRAEKLTPRNVKKVCSYLKVDGVLDGTLVQDDDGYRLVVRLRSAADGVIEKKIPLRMNQPWLSEQLNNELARRLTTAIDNLPAADKDGRDATRVAAARDKPDEGEDDEKGSGKGKDGEDDERAVVAGAGKKGSKGSKGSKKTPLDEVEPDDQEVEADKLASARDAGKADEEGDDAEGQGPEEEDELEDEPKDGQEVAANSEDGEDQGDAGTVDREAADGQQTTSIRTTPLLVNLGVSFIGRKLTFDYTGTVAEQAPPGYSGTPVPGGYLTAEAYPGGFGGDTKGVAANIGIGIVLDRVFSLNSSVADATGTAVNLPTRMWRYGANLRYRHNFSDGPNGFSMHGAVGYNTAGFSIDKSGAPGGMVDVPNVNYKYVDIGAGARIPIAGAFSLLAEAKVLAPMTTGPIQELDQYGPATVFGYEGEAVFEYQITRTINARAGGRLMQLSYTFDGDGDLDDRDGNGENDVTGASDRFLGGFVTAGYSF
jgi:hypothetical protein